MKNKYKGNCKCGKLVKPYEGHAEKVNYKWIITCSDCFDKRDNSSCEDRACGDMAYEDRCAEACGF